MRSGPHPLHMHLSLASSILPDDETRVPALQKMVRGIQRYQNFKANPVCREYDVMMQIGRTKLLRVHKTSSVRYPDKPIVLVPSLINRASILDLTAEHSFVCWLAAQGFPVYMLDWGNLCAENTPLDLDDLVGVRLKQALEVVQKQTGYSAHLLGYCMGGTLSMGAPILWPDLTASLTLLAAPWDMHAGENSLCKRVQFWSGSVVPTIDAKGHLPASWLQSLFASLDPEMTLKKFSHFVDVPEGSAGEALFVAVEDWLNEGRDLPGPVAQTCIIDWFIKNVTAQNKWHLCGHVIAPEKVSCPVLVIASKRDRLVTYESAIQPFEKFSKAKHVQPDCGHIGMMVGRNSKQQVWQAVSDWVGGF